MELEDFRKNVHDVIARRATHGLHEHIADMESTRDGLTNMQRAMILRRKD